MHGKAKHYLSLCHYVITTTTSAGGRPASECTDPILSLTEQVTAWTDLKIGFEKQIRFAMQSEQSLDLPAKINVLLTLSLVRAFTLTYISIGSPSSVQHRSF